MRRIRWLMRCLKGVEVTTIIVGGMDGGCVDQSFVFWGGGDGDLELNANYL